MNNTNPKKPGNSFRLFLNALLKTFFSLLGVIGWLLHTLLQVLTVTLICGLIAGTFIFIKVKPELDRSLEVAYDKLAQMDETDFSMLSDTEIYDKDGRRIGQVNAGHYEYVDIKDISLNIQNAYIAQEDRRFKSHNGVDWIATMRAGAALVKHRGEITQGGSTITQQVIKNTYLTQEQTFTRKMVEILLAPAVEMKFSKADIMEFYCNTNFYGHQCYGVQAASRYYFGKEAADLEVYEAAVLVGISNSPSAYDPVKNPQASLNKRNEILKSMWEVDMLTKEQYDDAISRSLSIVQEEQEGTDDNYMSSYAIHCAALELMKKEEFEFKYVFDNKEDQDTYMQTYNSAYSEKTEDIRAGGYQIYTTLDQQIQAELQASVDQTLSSFTELQENGKYALQGAAAVVDNRTNHVVAIVGGRGAEDQFNRAYLSARQPGSTIKPLLDYGPAFDTGEYFPSRIVDDHQWEEGPSNSGGRYYGKVTVREALNRSLNTVAWQVLDDIGINNGLQYLGNMNFQKLTYVDNGVSSLSIGGFTNGVRIVDMAKGYSTLANGGIYNDSTCIRSIEHEQQGSLTAAMKADTRQVYQADTTFMLTDVLKGTMTQAYGTGRGLSLANDMPAAGKTGTTNSSKDTWYCGYTRYYTTAVWVGYDIPRAMPGVYGSTYAGKIWKNVMNSLHDGLEPLDWERPETVIKDTFHASTGMRSHPNVIPAPEDLLNETDAAEAGQIDDTDDTAPQLEYTEPEAVAGTNLVDYFSTGSELRAQQSIYDKEQRKITEELFRETELFETMTIASVPDVDTVRSQYEKLTSLMDQLEEGENRQELHDRVTQRWSYFTTTMDGMQDSIRVYEEEKAALKDQRQQQADLEAAQRQAEQDRQTRIDSFNLALSAVQNLEYQAMNADTLIRTAIGRLSDLAGYTDTASYSAQLDEAIRRIRSLPTAAEWSAAKEAHRAAEMADGQAKVKEQQDALYDVLSQEQKDWNNKDGATGPGRNIAP